MMKMWGGRGGGGRVQKSSLGLPVEQAPAHTPAPPPCPRPAQPLAEGEQLLSGLMAKDDSGPSAWLPILNLLPYDDNNGYHHRIHDGTEFVGAIRDGIPEGHGALRWPDGSEYHGNFSRGVLHGSGVYIFPEGERFAGTFSHGMPQDGFLTETNGVLHKVSYRGDRALWAGAAPVEQSEMPNPIIAAGRLDVCAALVDDSDTGPQSMDLINPGHYSHIRDVTAPLVYARPQYGEQPLWNASEVRGKIVAIMRGPPPPHAGTPYAVKVYNAQVC